MAADPTPARFIQPQRLLEPLLEPHLATANLASRPISQPRAIAGRTFDSNEQIWRAVIDERMRGHMAVALRQFHVFEWFPRAPGLFHTSQGSNARDVARMFFDPRFARRGSGEHTDVFLPEGKMSMLEGGVGCVRLKPLEKDAQILWWFTASSSAVAHEGFPIALPQELCDSVIEVILEHGSVTCDLRGQLRFLPDAFDGLYPYSGVPQLYLEVEDISSIGASLQQNVGRYLRAVDLEQLRERVGKVARTRVFLSYSRRDRLWKDRVAIHLQPLVRSHSIDDWSDDRIQPGADWEEEIDSAIESAQAAILLISADFMASDFIQEKELPTLIASAKRGEITLFPIVIGACGYGEHAELSRFQAVHDVAHPLNLLTDGEHNRVLDQLRQKLKSCLTRQADKDS